MKTLFESVQESLVNKTIDVYLTNIKSLNPNKQQHFLTRLGLCGYDVDPNFESIISDVSDSIDHIADEDYQYVIDKYTMSSYKNTNKTDIISCINSVQDINAKQYLAWISILSSLIILVRNGVNIPKKLDQSIHKTFDTNQMLYSHRFQTSEFKVNCGTLYINFIGALRFLASVGFFDIPNLDELWMESRLYYTKSNTFVPTNVYGLTHIIINATNFYTTPLDVQEYDIELKCIEQFLEGNPDPSEYPLDIICEAALCNKIGGGNLWKNYLKMVNKLVDSKTHIIQNYKKVDDVIDNLDKNEHTNILYIMLDKFKPRVK